MEILGLLVFLGIGAFVVFVIVGLFGMSSPRNRQRALEHKALQQVAQDAEVERINRERAQ